MRNKENKVIFAICICVGIATIAFILISTPFHELCLLDARNDHKGLSGLIWDKTWKPAYHWLLKEWSHQPTNSTAANIIIGALHALPIGLVVLLVMSLTFSLYCIFYGFPVIVGSGIGIIVGYVVYAFSIILNKLGTGFAVASPHYFELAGGLFVLYVADSFLIGSGLYLITSIFLKPVSGTLRKEAVRTMSDKKQTTKALVSSRPQALTRQEFELDSLQESLLRYGTDRSLIKTHFSGLVERGKYEAHTKLVQKKLEMINAITQCMESLREAREAYHKLQAVDEIEAIQRAKRSLEMLEVLYQRDKLEQAHRYELELNVHRADVEREKLELEKTKLKMEQAKLLLEPGKEAREKKDEKIEKIEQITDQLLFMQKTMDKLKELFKDRPEMDDLLDLFNRMLVEEGVIVDLD